MIKNAVTYKESSSYDLMCASQCFFGRDLSKPPPRNKIRFLNMYPNIPRWIHETLYTMDKSYKEWINLISNYKQNTVFPFLKSDVNLLESLFLKHMRIRFIIQTWIRQVRKRIFQRRKIGLVDLYTTQLIPESSRVEICDYNSKSVYIFHTQTAIRIILAALKHSLYGIPDPHIPKNPYTNIPFNIQQLIKIHEQIWINCAHSHHIPPINLYHFRKANYSIDTYKRAHRHTLNIDSARTLLFSFHDPYSREVYMEVLNDTIEIENLDLVMTRWIHLRRHIQNRSLSQSLLSRIDNIVLSLFLYQNHSISYIFRTYTETLREFQQVYTDSIRHLSTLGPRAFQIP